MQPTLLLGQTLELRANPFHHGLGSAAHRERGGVLIADGRIVAVDDGQTLREAHPRTTVVDHGAHLILPGFVDAHAHYSQTAIIASWGKRLIDWLNTYTFPEEARFASAPYATEIAERYLDLNLANGITTACCYCTIHPQSVDALMGAAQSRGMAMTAGKVMMDRNAPDTLRDTAQSSYDDSKALIETWHGRGRLRYAITPRFAPTSTPAQLDAAGTLAREHPECPIQTHLSEQLEEIAWVRTLYPEADDYFGVYETHGLTGPRAIMGHAIHLSDREWAAIAETGTTIAHCPTSNCFIGSGLFDMDRAQTAQIPTGLATDVGGGSSFSMLRTMATAYEVGQLRGRSLHPAELLWLATAGAAEVLGLEGEIGTLAAGTMADLVVLDLASTPVIAQASARAETLWQAVFPTIMLGDDRAIARAYIAGNPVS